VRALESVLIETLGGFDIAAERVEGRPGVWVGNEKLAAIGVRLQDGVTRHGFALNVTTDLERFEAIVPCGLHDAGVTSMQRLLGRAPDLRDVADALLAAFERTFDSHTISLSRAIEPNFHRELVFAHGG
jgi:lipoyl(octanoyl) transferase